MKKVIALLAAAAVILTAGCDMSDSKEERGDDSSTSSSSSSMSSGSADSEDTDKSNSVPVESSTASEDGSTTEKSPSVPEESSIPEPILADEADFETEAVEGGVCITKYIGSGKNIIIPDTIGGEKVIMLGNEAFYNNTDIVSVTIPDSVVSVGEGDEYFDYQSFRDCKNLSEVIFLGDDMPYFSVFTFGGTPWWNSKEAENPDDYIVVNNVLMQWQKDEGVAVIPDGVTKINPWAFRVATNVTGIEIPDSVTEIGEYAFADLGKITEITLPDSVTEIGSNIFNMCVELKKVTLSKNIKKIPERTFWYCVNLETVDIPDGVTSIENEAFAATTGGQGVNIPDSVTEISIMSGIGDFTYKGVTYHTFDSDWGAFYEVFEGIIT